MQRPGDDPVWDLVICITAGVGAMAWLLGAFLTLKIALPLPLNNRFASLVCFAMTLIMLSTTVGYWFQWKHRR